MNELDYFKLIRYWLLSLLGYVVIMFLYAFIMGRTTGDIAGSDILSILSLLIGGTSVLVGFASIIYSIYMKKYIYSLHDLGILTLSILLAIISLVMALDCIY